MRQFGAVNIVGGNPVRFSEGLVIVTASAPGCLDKKVHFQGRTNTATLLSRYASVDKALKALENMQSIGAGKDE